MSWGSRRSQEALPRPLVTTAFGLFVAVPAVMAFNAFSNRIETPTVEMDNSASELLDYFIERRKVIPR